MRQNSFCEWRTVEGHDDSFDRTFRIAFTTLRCLYQEQGISRTTQNFFSHASEQAAVYPRPAMGSHGNQYPAVAGGLLDHHLFRFSFGYSPAHLQPGKRLANALQIGFAMTYAVCNKTIQVQRFFRLYVAR